MPRVVLVDRTPVARSRLHERLRTETADLHAEAEAALNLFGAPLSEARYRSILAQLRGFYAPLEPRCVAIAATVPLDIELRARTPLLDYDLQALGMPPDELAALPRCEALPQMANAGHLAGCLYVIEGACLGGRVIAKEVERQLGLTRARGLAFFVGDDSETATRWRSVLRTLDELVAHGLDQSEIVASARGTFRALTCWIGDGR